MTFNIFSPVNSQQVVKLRKTKVIIKLVLRNNPLRILQIMSIKDKLPADPTSINE